MKKKQLLFLFILMICPLYGQAFRNFITASGPRLMDGNNVFRFISFNVPTLNYQEDEMEFKVANPYTLPDEFEIRDVFETVKEMGGQVIRFYTIPVRNNSFPPESPTYVEAPGKFNEDAFKVTDRILALANEYQIRIIFSLLNNFQWMGGRPNYAEFRGKNAEEFWTDRQLIDDFKQTIRYTVNRKNMITGVTYKDDKAILCWETGNELSSPMDWTIEICRYIKSLDPNHLIMDGYYAINEITVREESVLEGSIDILSSHHYERNPFEIPENIRRNLAIINGRKPYIIGEFGFVSTSAIETILDTVIAEKRLSGILIWSLRHHRSKGGFYWHSEPFGMGLYKAYHWPGFESGENYDEKNLLWSYRVKAFEIQKKEVPPISIPKPPVLLPIVNIYSINWKGSMGASGYTIERADNEEGPWKITGYNISDAVIPYFPLFHDKTAEIGKKYFYRVIALNSAGLSQPSNIVGPIEVNDQALIDAMKNTGTLQESKNIVPETGNDRSFKEIINRLAGDYGSEITYKIPGSFKQLNIYAFEQSWRPVLKVYFSVDGEEWEEFEISPQRYTSRERNYAYWPPSFYTCHENTEAKFLKLVFTGECKLARVEIIYD